MSNLFLFANNNDVAENLGSYRLYNMTIEGDSEGVDSGVNYVDYLESTGTQYIDTGIIPTLDMTFYGDYTFASYNQVAFGSSERIRSYGIYQSSNRVHYGGYTNITGYSLKTYGHRYQNTLTPTGYTLTCVDENITISGNYTHTPSGTCTYTMRLFGEPRNADGGMYYASSKIYDFKIYNAQGTLIQHLRPCLDTSGIPCMYDEVTKKYFYNKGTGTFRYKKKLRDFQPVLDKNNIPCLMDKINKKYYYDKNGYGFKCAEQNYKAVSYIQGDGDNYLDIGDWTIDQNTEIRIGTSCVIGNIVMSSDLNTFSIYRISQGSYYGRNNNKFGNKWYSDKTYADIIMNANEFTVNGSTITLNNTTFSNSTNLRVFGSRVTQISTSNAVGKVDLYYLQIYQSNELMLDLIPVLDNNNIPCMYDKVSQQFFYNQGTGAFNYGIEESECPKANYVEYLKSPSVDNNISTGIPYDNTYSKIEFKFNQNHPNNITDEILRAGSDRTFWFWIYYGTLRFADLKGIEFDVLKDVSVVIKPNECIINGTSHVYSTPLSSVSSDMILFSYASHIKLYYFKVYDSEGNLIQDLRPSLDNNDIPCMYDIVSDSYYYNTGDDKFEYGESIGYTPISYIESNGNQYIDTGVTINDNIDIDMVCRATNKKPQYIMNGLIIDGTYKYNEMDTTVESNINSDTTATLTLGNTYATYLTKDEIITSMMNGWIISGVSNITMIKAEDDVTTLTANENIITCIIELTDSNKSSRIDEVLAYYPNCTEIYFFQDGSITSLSKIFQNNTTYRKQIKKIVFMDGYFEGTYSLQYTFASCINMTEVVNLPTPSNAQGIFQNCERLNMQIDFSNATSSLDMSSCFQNCKKLTYTPILPNGMKGNMSNCFNHCESLTTIDISNIQSTNNASQTFQYCTKLTKIIGIEKLVATRTQYAHSIFEHCESLESIDISGWDTSGCKQLGTPSTYTYGGMFSSCYKLKEIKGLNNINFSGLSGGSASFTLGKFFRNCYELTSLDLSSWDVSKVNDFGGMFYGCEKLQTLNLTGWDMSSCGTYEGMFRNCSVLTEIKGIETWTKDATTNYMYQGTPLLSTYYIPLNDSASGDYNKQIFTGDSSLASKTIIWRNELNYSLNLANLTNPNGVYLSQQHIQDLIPEHLGTVDGMTLTLGGYSSYLTEDEIAQAVAKGWIVQ